MTTYLVRTYTAGTIIQRPIRARTPQAAARKVAGRPIRTDPPRLTAAGDLHEIPFTIASPRGAGNGTVQWPANPDVALFHYPDRPRVTPFWANPTTWDDPDNPITPFTVTEPADPGAALHTGDHVVSDYGPAVVTEATSRSVTFQVTDGPDQGTTLNIVTGTPGYDRLLVGRTP